MKKNLLFLLSLMLSSVVYAQRYTGYGRGYDGEEGLTIIDTIYSINPALISNKNIEVKNFLFQLFNQHYNEIFIDKEEEKYIDKDIFLNQLTHAEHNALKNIAKEIGSCGSISISKMVQKYTISRPVWTNLFKKIQEFKVGEIINQGVKGTYINITHPQLRYDAEHHKI